MLATALNNFITLEDLYFLSYSVLDLSKNVLKEIKRSHSHVQLSHLTVSVVFLILLPSIFHSQRIKGD